MKGKLTHIILFIVFLIIQFSAKGENYHSTGSEKRIFKYGTPDTWQSFYASWEKPHSDWEKCVIDLPYADSIKVLLVGHFKDQKDTFFMQRNDAEGFATRNALYPSFPLDFNFEETDSITLIIQLKHYRKAIFAVYLETPEYHTQRSKIITIFFWSILSAIGVIILYNLFLYIGVLERIYLVYVVTEITVLSAQASNYGFTFQYFWPSNFLLSKYALNFFVFFSGLASIQFFIELLGTKQNYPLFNKVAVYVRIAYLIGLLPTFWGFVDLSYLAVSGAAGILSSFGIFVAVKVWQKGYRTGLYFLIAWMVFLIGIILFVGKDFGFFPYNNITLYTMPFGAALETVLLSFALADRINILKKEKEESQARAINEMRRSQIVINEQNRLLEEKVKQRTYELQHINEQLSETIENLKTTQSQLVDAEKMASLGQLTAGIAHEINNPINFVSSNVEPLKQDITDLKTVLAAYRTLHLQSENVKERLSEISQIEDQLDIDYAMNEIDDLINGIREGAGRTIDIVKSLRIFSRSEESGIQPADINEGIQSTLTILGSQLKSLQVSFVPAELPNVYCQIGRLNQVFMNIITNAIQAIHDKFQGNPGGILRIESEINGELVHIRFSDNGKGIPQEIQNKIFEPFFTTKEVGKGTGLGLSISYGIVEDHHGHISVRSIPGEGTTFEITIPVNSEGKPLRSDAA